MKVRESGMPNEKLWEEFFEPKSILRILELNHNAVDIAEFGYGYGTFTIPVSKVVRGTVTLLILMKKWQKELPKEQVKKN